MVQKVLVGHVTGKTLQFSCEILSHTHCRPSLMRAGTFSCSPQTVAVGINSPSDSGAYTEVDYSDPCSKLRACCAMHASPTAWFTLMPAHRSKSTLWGTQRVKT